MKKVLFAVMAALLLLASCNKESSEKKILEFKFASPAVEAVITENAKTIVAVVPTGTDVTALVPIITVSDKASVSPASGTVIDFTNPVVFTVTAEDGSTTTYVATVTVDQNGGGGGGGGTGDPTTWSGSIDANTTWPDLGLPVDYIIDGWFYIEGNALLTIEPGVTIMFANTGSGFEVNENAGLRMVGTVEKPIILEGPQNNPNNGSWYGVRVNSKRADNQFEYVQFLRGGSGDGPWEGVVRVADGRLGMKNCLIDGSLCNGLVVDYDEAYLTAFENNTIKNCAIYPLNCENFKAACKNIGRGNVFVENGNNVVSLGGNCDLSEDLTLHELSIPYKFKGDLNIGGTKALNIEAGTTLVMPYNSSIRVYEETPFIANGSAEKPIIFTCDEEAWNGMVFESTRGNSNSINYCHFENCGFSDSWGDRCCLYIRSEARLALTNNVFGPSNYNGVGIESIENWGNVTHSGNTFTGCAGGNVWIEGSGEWNGVWYDGDTTLEYLP